MKRIAGFLIAAVAAGSVGLAPAAPALAKKKLTTEVAPDIKIEEIEAALDEQRLVDAGRMIDRALIYGSSDLRVIELNGELDLARGRYDDAIKKFRQAAAAPGMSARVKQGQGLALSLLGKTDEALPMLKAAVAEDPNAWRAWNALGGEYDRRRDWVAADAAYEHALTASSRSAIVLNNRGFSRVLQNRLDDGIADLVAALEKKPDLSAARTNLRLAMALKGDYERALAAGPQEDKAALLNNVGYAALLRGDHAEAQVLFNKAIAARGQYYGRATNNLEMSTGLQARASQKDSARPAPAANAAQGLNGSNATP